jgi:hypothetical protein
MSSILDIFYQYNPVKSTRVVVPLFLARNICLLCIVLWAAPSSWDSFSLNGLNQEVKLGYFDKG